jgi:xanthine/CO dehydrogenase XdhC/CoxF family maturation factor
MIIAAAPKSTTRGDEKRRVELIDPASLPSVRCALLRESISHALVILFMLDHSVALLTFSQESSSRELMEDDMRIAMIGAGNVGRALGGALVRCGHEVVISSARPEHARTVAGDIGADAAGSRRPTPQFLPCHTTPWPALSTSS